jgi:hypothetical protein
MTVLLSEFADQIQAEAREMYEFLAKIELRGSGAPRLQLFVIGPLVAQGIRTAWPFERLMGDHDLLGDRFPNSSVIVRQFERNGLQITLEQAGREPVSLPRFHPLPANLIEAWLIQDIRRSILRSLERDPWKIVSWLAYQGVKVYREFRLHKPSPAMRGEAEKSIWRPAVLPAIPFDP